MYKQITSKSSWEKALDKFPQANFLQSWNWGETHSQLNKKVIRISFSSGIAQIVKEDAKRGTYLTCPGGPLLDWNNPGLTEFTNILHPLCRDEKALFVRIRPQVSNSPDNRNILKQLGWHKAPMHMHAETTWQLDLTQPEETILANMRKTTRYLIRKAQKSGVKIEFHTDPKYVKLLYDLELETASRHHFIPFGLDFLSSHFQAFTPDENMLIAIGIWNNQVVSAAMIIFYRKEAVYHYSGSSTSYPEVPVNYLLQWEVIKEAKRRGCKTYNFWGIAATDNPKHRFAGVTTFKKGFGGFRFDYLPAHDLPASILYYPSYLFELARHKLRRLS